MKKIRTFILITFLIIFAVLIVLNFNYLEKTISDFIANRLSTWGYLGYFFFVFLLEAVPQPFLSALVLLVTGSLLGFNFLNLFWLTIISSILANYVAYFLGLTLGDSTVGLIVSEVNYKKSLVWFDRYGKKGISLLALTPLPYFPIIGGLFKMTLYEFTKYAIIPRILHFLIFSSILILTI